MIRARRAVHPLERQMRTTDETTTKPSGIDGRTARRHRNRTAVLDAVADLFSEGNLTPGVHEVAERSGVSLRSVYRYFADVDELIAAAIDREVQAAGPLFTLPQPGEGPLPARIQRFCERRVALYARVRSVYRAALIRSSDQRRHCDGVDRSREQLRRQVGMMFGPELEAMPVAEAEVVAGMLDCLAQFETLEHLFAARDHDVAATTSFLTAAFNRVLLPGADA